MKPQNKNNLISNKLSGEFIFTCVLFLIGIVALILSIKLQNKISEPLLSSAAAVPLLTSLLWCVLTLYLIIKSIFAKTYKVKTSANSIFLSKKIIGTILAVICYCTILYLGMNFYIASFCLLFGLITFLGIRPIEKNAMIKFFLKNIIVSVIVLVFIYLIFGLAFGILK